MPPAHTHVQSLPITSGTPCSSTLVTSDEAMRHNPPKSTVDVTAHCVCYTSCGLGQIYDDTNPSLWDHTVGWALNILWDPFIHPSAFPSVLLVFTSLQHSPRGAIMDYWWNVLCCFWSSSTLGFVNANYLNVDFSFSPLNHFFKRIIFVIPLGFLSIF